MFGGSRRVTKSFTPVLSAQFILCAHQQPPPCCRQIGAGAIDVRSASKARTEGAPRKLGVGPGANLIESFAIRAARRLRRGGDPHDQIGTLGL